MPARWLGSVRLWLSATLGCLALLGMSGAWLTVRYRPDRPEIPEPGARLIRFPHHGGGWIGDVHRVLAVAMYVSIAGLVLVLLVAAVRRRVPGWVGLPVVAALAATLVARSSGDGLPWSQLALWAVTVNTTYEGVWRAAFDPVVRFVLTDVEVGQAEYRVWVLTHVFAVPALLLAAIYQISVMSTPRSAARASAARKRSRKRAAVDRSAASGSTSA